MNLINKISVIIQIYGDNCHNVLKENFYETIITEVFQKFMLWHETLKNDWSCYTDCVELFM